jgi:hypothetical protein
MRSFLPAHRPAVVRAGWKTLFKVDLRLYVVKNAVVFALRREQPGDPARTGVHGVRFPSGEAPSAQQYTSSQATGERIGGPQLR